MGNILEFGTIVGSWFSILTPRGVQEIQQTNVAKSGREIQRVEWRGDEDPESQSAAWTIGDKALTPTPVACETCFAEQSSPVQAQFCSSHCGTDEALLRPQRSSLREA